MILGAIEKQFDSESTIKCHDIVSTISQFGVTEIEILKIIKLLAMELENREQMLKIFQALEGEV